MSNYAKLWMTWVALAQVILAWATLFYPEWMQSSAYDVAFSIVPIQVVGALAATSALAALLGIAKGKTEFLLAGAGIAIPIHILFGYSIFALTVQGVTSAIIGSVQWFTIPIGTLLLLVSTTVRGQKVVNNGWVRPDSDR